MVRIFFLYQKALNSGYKKKNELKPNQANELKCCITAIQNVIIIKSVENCNRVQFNVCACHFSYHFFAFIIFVVVEHCILNWLELIVSGQKIQRLPFQEHFTYWIWVGISLKIFWIIITMLYEACECFFLFRKRGLVGSCIQNDDGWQFIGECLMRAPGH